MAKDQIIVITVSGRGDKTVPLLRATEGRTCMNRIEQAFANGKAFIALSPAAIGYRNHQSLRAGNGAKRR